jgi:serine/threonine protein kinase
MEIRIAHRFKLVKKIGSGAFGQIFEGVDLVTQETVAVKLVYFSFIE